MHLTMPRPSPYTIPSQLHTLQRSGASYGVSFSTEPGATAIAAATTCYTPPQSFYSSSAFQSGCNYGSCSYSNGAGLYGDNSPMRLAYASSSSRSSALCSPQSPQDTAPAFSPTSSNEDSSSVTAHTPSPQLHGEDCPELKSCCQYSTPPFSNTPNSQSATCSPLYPQSAPFYSLPAAACSPNSDQSLFTAPAVPSNNSAGQPYGTLPSCSSTSPSSNTSSSMYTIPDYHPPYSSPLNFSNNPSFSSMALWNYQSLSQFPKVSYDTPRYKLTPERALPLIKWFEEHKEHPYPSRHEKMALCQATQLTFTQVSTWFANARRRMKKAAQEEDSSEESSNSDKESS